MARTVRQFAPGELEIEIEPGTTSRGAPCISIRLSDAVTVKTTLGDAEHLADALMRAVRAAEAANG